VDVSVKDVVITASPSPAPVTAAPIAPGETGVPTAGPVETPEPTDEKSGASPISWMKLSIVLTAAASALLLLL
jgi:hypothetical protein